MAGFESIYLAQNLESWDEEFIVGDARAQTGNHLLTIDKVRAWVISRKLEIPTNFVYLFPRWRK